MQRPVLIIEDDHKIARIIMAYLEGADFRALHADSGVSAKAALAKELPLAVILDLGLPDITGDELCQDIKAMGDIPVIMLTSRSSEEERIAGFALGADDYVVKPASPRELVYRVKAVLKRYDSNDGGSRPQSFNSGQLVLDSVRHTITKNGEQLPITPSEFKLIQTLAASPGRAFTRDELVSRALGYQFEGYERSIDAHIKNLRQKLETDSHNPQYIKTVYGIGYQFCGVRDAI